MLAFQSAPDYEDGSGHVYEVVIRVSDGVLQDLQTLTVNVADVPEARNEWLEGTAYLSLLFAFSAAGLLANDDRAFSQITLIRIGAGQGEVIDKGDDSYWFRPASGFCRRGGLALYGQRRK